MADELTVKPTNAIQEIVKHIANGGTLVSFCKDTKLEYSVVSSWISADPERSKQYLAACTARAEWVINRTEHELALMAFSDIRDIFNEDGSMKSPHEIPEHISRAIEVIEVDELFDGVGRDRKQIGVTKRIKLTPKLKALELFGKQHGMFRERVEHTGSLTLEKLIESSYKKDNE